MIHYRDEHLGRLLQASYRDFNNQFLQKMREEGYEDITQFQAELLSYIELDGTRVQYLIDKTSTTKQAIGEAVSHLEAAGYIRKTAYPADKRVNILRFTRLGEQFLFDEHRVKAEIEQAYMKLLGRQEFERMQKNLQIITLRKRQHVNLA